MTRVELPTRRVRWQRKRRDRGLEEPAPLPVRVANCASVSTGAARSRETFQRALTTPANRWVRKGLRRRRVLVSTGILPDLILADECADFDAAEVAGREWDVAQRGDLGSAESALVIAVRKTRGHLTDVQLEAGVAATSEGGGIRQRPILTASVVVDPGTPQRWVHPVAAAHAHPARAPRARGAFLHLLEGFAGRTIGADLNLSARAAARILGRRVLGIGVLCLAVARWIRISRATPVEHGSDHLGVDATLWPAKRPTRHPKESR